MNIIGFSGLHDSLRFKQREWPNLSSREYRVAQGYDSAAALVNEKGVVAAVAEERFIREKATSDFPVNSIRYCLQAGGLRMSDVEVIAHGFSYEPFKEYFQSDAYSQRQYAEVFDPGVQRAHLHNHFASEGWNGEFVPVSHHMAHAASAFYLSGFEESLILVSDGMGEIHSMSVAVGRGNDIEIIRQVTAAHSVGILYGAFTLYLGFYMAMDEYKIMGLAPYGDRNRYFASIMELVDLRADGTYVIPCLSSNQTQEEKETHRGVLRFLEEKFGPQRRPGEEVTQDHKDLAAGLQAVLQACQMHVLRHFKRETGQRNLCMAGGVALNCSVNGIVNRSRTFDRVFVQPAAGDDGASLGAALYAQRQLDPNFKKQKSTMPLWGPSSSEDEIREVIGGQDAIEVDSHTDFESVCRDTAARLADGQIIAWYQGNMEFGPRALGCRSILADPRVHDMRDRINSLVKKREGFRPFAPAVTTEAAREYFEIAEGDEDAYENMLFICQVKAEYRDQLPAVTHVDGSARVQTVSENGNPPFWQLLREFERLSGLPMLLNTSFNVKGQPIVCTPQEALDTFLFARLDALVIGNSIVVPGSSEHLDRARDESTKRIASTLVGS